MNGYFQIITDDKGTSIRLIPPTDGGNAVGIKEVSGYLTKNKIPYDLKTLNNEIVSLSDSERVLFLSPDKIMPVSESCNLYMTPDRMTVTARFFPASEGGRTYNKEDIYSELRLNKVVKGVDDEALDKFIANKQFCTDIIVAKGRPTKEGHDAKIEYHFPTDNKIKPKLLEDGTVDFKNLNVVNHCKAGDLLAELIPEDRGEPGEDVCGNVIKPHDVRRMVLSFGRNIQISEDKRKIYSMVNGHVSYVDGKVFVADVLEVENVDNSTGNLTYEGNIKINGTVCSNFSVKCNGNIEVSGIVEGAELEAGGNIILARGINGMGKGRLKAGGNIVAKFLENCTAESGGYIETDSILHSNVQAKTEINVMSKKGFITGGSVTATNCIRVKTLGSPMGALTEVSVGVDPIVINHYHELTEEIETLQKNLKISIPVLDASKKKLASGVKFLPEQIKQLQTLALQVKENQEKLNSDVMELEGIKEVMDSGTRSSIEVFGEVYAGTKVTISDSGMIIKDSFKYCRFTKEQGTVKIGPL